MYKGTETETIPLWRDKYFPGLGMFTIKGGATERELEVYECDHCGRIAKVLGKAEVDFFCRRCPGEISIKPAPELPETNQ